MDEESNRDTMWNIRARLYAVNSFFAYQDFKRANPKGRRYDKQGRELRYNPYTLSPLTNEAREHYHLATKEVWTDEEEAQIKAYVMRLRISGQLDDILEWEKDTGDRYQRNPWRRN